MTRPPPDPEPVPEPAEPGAVTPDLGSPTLAQPLVVVVMGVSGTGKTSIGELLAEALDVDFVEGDHHHPESNIAKMSAGTPLTDDDRWPWLHALAELAAARLARDRSLVLTCSALKRSYRDVLRSGAPPDRVFFVHLHADVEVLTERMGHRTKHFMPPSLLTSQLETLEPLGDDETGAVVDVAASLSDVAAAALDALDAELTR